MEIRNKDWYGNQTIGLRGLNSQLATYYKANPGLSKAGPLAISQIIGKNPGHPFLKAKAAQVRHLAEFGLVLANKHLGFGDDGRVPFRFNRTHRLFPRLQEHLENLVATFQGMTRYVRSLSATPFDPDACREGMFLYLSSMGKLQAGHPGQSAELEAAVQREAEGSQASALGPGPSSDLREP